MANDLLCRYAALGNLTGVPAVTVPMGYTDNGLPLGFQVMAPWWREDVCLNIGRLIETSVEKQRPEHYLSLLSEVKS